MVLAEGVRAGIAGLRFAAADVAARCAQAEVERGATLLAGVAAGRGDRFGRVLASAGGSVGRMVCAVHARQG